MKCWRSSPIFLKGLRCTVEMDTGTLILREPKKSNYKRSLKIIHPSLNDGATAANKLIKTK